jgi:hypothetical protein
MQTATMTIAGILRDAATLAKIRFKSDKSLSADDLITLLGEAGARTAARASALRLLRTVALGSPEPGPLADWLLSNSRDVVIAALLKAAEQPGAEEQAP